LSTPQPSAATRAPAHDARAPTRVARAAADEPVAGESLYAHAKRSFRSTVSAAVTPVLDAGIAFLQSLRKRAGGAQGANREVDEDRLGPGSDRPGGRRAAAAPLTEVEAQAPKPKRRLRALLVYLSVLLAGGMGGGVLAYDLLQELLANQFAKSERLEAMISKHSKSAATTQQKLEEAQAKRIEAEKKLEASLAEYTKSTAEKQKKLDDAEKRPEMMFAAERARNAQRPSPVSPGSATRKAPQLKTGNCVMSSGNIVALKGCIEDFNR
jgi:hypothetical protein